MDRVDLPRVTARVLDSVDIDAVAARLDLDAVAARLDVNAVVDRVDLARVTEQVLDEVDVGHIVRESSGAMAAETVDAVRMQGMRVDGFLSRVVDRLLARPGGRDTGPLPVPDVVGIDGHDAGAAPARRRGPAGTSRRLRLPRGRRGRSTSRVITLLGLVCLLFAALVRYLVVGPPFVAPTLPQWLSAAVAAGIPVVYLTAGWATVGRTVGMQVLGLRLLGRSGRPPGLAAALLRAVLCLAFPAGLLWTLVSRRNASIQDLVVRTAVVYDWSYGPPAGAKSPPADEARARQISEAGHQQLPGGRNASTRTG